MGQIQAISEEEAKFGPGLEIWAHWATLIKLKTQQFSLATM